MASRCLQGGLPLHLPSGRCSATLLGGAAPSISVVGGGRTSMKVSALSTGDSDLRPCLGENPEGIISGEWPDNISLLSYDDLRAYFEAQPAEVNKIRPSPQLGEVMSTPVQTATTDQTLEEIDHHFRFFSGVPVVDSAFRCIGIVSDEDRTRGSHHGLKTRVGEVMSSPAITLTPDRTVKDAAAVMLKMKIHRIPIVDGNGQLVGIVTRTDVYQAMEA